MLKVLRATGDLVAAPVPTAAARDPTAAVEVQTAAVPDRTVGALAQSAGVADLTAPGDRDAVAVHSPAAFPHVTRALSGKVAAHNCEQVDQSVAQAARFAPGVQVARVDPCPPAVGSVPGVPADQFVQADLFSLTAPDDRQGSQSPMPALWSEQLTVAALAATR